MNQCNVNHTVIEHLLKPPSLKSFLHHFRITLNQHIILQLNIMYRQTAVVRELVGNTDVTSDLRVAIGQQSSGNPRLADAKNQPTNQAQLCN